MNRPTLFVAIAIVATAAFAASGDKPGFAFEDAVKCSTLLEFDARQKSYSSTMPFDDDPLRQAAYVGYRLDVETAAPKGQSADDFVVATVERRLPTIEAMDGDDRTVATEKCVADFEPHFSPGGLK